MKIVCISDTHLRQGFKVPNGDVLVHAGDLTRMGSDKEVILAAKWLKSLPHREKIVIAGNHDWLFQREPVVAQGIMKAAGLTYLEDSWVNIRDRQFYGSPWQPWFCDWAFNLRRGEEIDKKWRMIPGGVDVLITHGPPYLILDGVVDETSDNGGYDFYKDTHHVGCKDLARKILSLKPRLHIFGHVHGGYGMIEKEGTTYINASICDEDYEPTNQPIVVEI